MEIHINNMLLDDIITIKPIFSKYFDEFWSFETLKNDFKDKNSKYIVAKLDSNIVGFAGIKIIIDEADIMNIAVRVDMRNQGIGSLLLEKLIEIAKDSNCESTTLEVNEKNSPAIHLYEKYGFERIGFRKKYYNMDNAIIMTRRNK